MLVEIGSLKKIFINNAVLWPAHDSAYQPLLNKNFIGVISNTTISFNNYPKLKAGDYAIILDCTESLRDQQIVPRIKVLTKYGIGWVSNYMLGI